MTMSTDPLMCIPKATGVHMQPKGWLQGVSCLAPSGHLDSRCGSNKGTGLIPGQHHSLLPWCHWLVHVHTAFHHGPCAKHGSASNRTRPAAETPGNLTRAAGSSTCARVTCAPSRPVGLPTAKEEQSPPPEECREVTGYSVPLFIGHLAKKKIGVHHYRSP